MKIRLRKQVHGCFAGASSLDEFLEKEMDIPFTPFPGLIIGDIDESIVSVVWNNKEKTMNCYTVEDKEIYDAELNHNKHRPLDEIVKEYLDAGWEKERV